MKVVAQFPRKYYHLKSLLFVSILVLLGCSSEKKNHQSTEEIIVYSSMYDSIPYEKGETLIQQHCNHCHALPDPQTLSKYNWEHLVLPYKARLFGLKMSKSYLYPSMRTPSNSHLFSMESKMSQEDWDQIVSFFVHEAPTSQLRQQEAQEPSFRLNQFEIKALPGQTFQPYASLLQIDEKRQRIYLGDSERKHIQVWTPSLELEKTLNIFGLPAHIQMRDDERHLVLTKPSVLPSDFLQGQIIQLSTEQENSTPETRILSSLPYSTDIHHIDFDQDGKEDILLNGHGFYIGRLSLFQQIKEGEYQEYIISPTPGAIKSEILDLNDDKLLDIITLFGQAQERIAIFYNQGDGKFEADTVLQFPPTLGSTDFQLIDVNGDSFLDIIHSSGKNAYPVIYKSFHGLRIYLNDGKHHFEEAYFYPLNGANHLAASDYDEDGDVDIAVTSFFPNYKDSPYEAFIYLENNGELDFSPKSFEKHPRGKWGFIKSGDIDGDGDIDIVLANNMLNAEKDSRAHQRLWMQGTPALLVLENQLK